MTLYTILEFGDECRNEYHQISYNIIHDYEHAKCMYHVLFVSRWVISSFRAGSDVLKCPITCEVLKDPVVAAGTIIHYQFTDINHPVSGQNSDKHVYTIPNLGDIILLPRPHHANGRESSLEN